MNKLQHEFSGLLYRGTRIIIFVIICSAILLTPKLAQASTSSFTINSTNYYIDGQKYSMDVAPYISAKSRIYLPIRYVAIAFGIKDADVNWDEEQQNVKLWKQNTTVQLQIGNPYITVNGVQTLMDVAPVKVNNRTMLPVAWLTNAFGYGIQWHDDTQSVSIYIPGKYLLPIYLGVPAQVRIDKISQSAYEKGDHMKYMALVTVTMTNLTDTPISTNLYKPKPVYDTPNGGDDQSLLNSNSVKELLPHTTTDVVYYCYCQENVKVIHWLY